MTKKEKDAYFAEHGTLPKVEKVTELNCKLIDPETVEKDFENIKELELLKKALISMEENNETELDDYNVIQKRINEIESGLFTDEYNVARYLDAFNKKVKPLLVCFHPDIRSKIMLDIVKVKDKTTKKTVERLKERVIFTKGECELISGMPFKEGDQDSYKDLMTMEDKEIKFWDKVDKVPNNMEEEEWERIRSDYHERMRIAKEEGIIYELELLDKIFKHLEVKHLNEIRLSGDLGIEILSIVGIDEETGMLISRKWGEYLYHITDAFKYEKEAIERDKYYKLNGKDNDDDRYEQWLDYLTECEIMTGKTYDMFATIDEGGLSKHETEVVIQSIDGIVEKVIEKNRNVFIENPTEVKKKKVYSESDDEDDDTIEEDENGNIIRNEEELLLDDEYDDTFGEAPEEYLEQLASVNGMDKEPELQEKEEPEDEWGF